ncbi:RICIN domain-containing protein [Spirosoma flavum]|uniref:RICIN domain-containing protein n=1 Tax=Spirosoma flavum TaxID=2048557 RepID=A0ABW6ALK9_9BACT
MNPFILYTLCLAGFASCHKPDQAGQNDLAPKEVLSTKAASSRLGVNSIAGANWADARDNFANDSLVLTGLSITDSYATVQSTSDKVVSGFQTLGINTIRLPLNPQTVLSPWWGSYQGAIDKAVSKNMKVIVAVWEASNSKDGRIDDVTKFWNLWQVVVNKYGSNPNVYFEPFNEPHGYSVTDLKSIYLDWLSRYPSVPRGRVVIGGAGYCTDVNSIGSDSQFDGCLLGYHNYAFFNTSITSVNGWDVKFGQDLIYPTRTIITEFGCPMTTGKNYTGSATDGELAYLQSITDVMNNRGIASVYWPGLRMKMDRTYIDSYSLTTFDGNALTVTNTTGLARLKYAWSLNDSPGGPFPSFDTGAYYRFVNRKSGKVLDVSQSSLSNGASIIQWPSNGGNNQQWNITSAGTGTFTLTNRNSAKVLDVTNASLAQGTALIQYQNNNGLNQQWRITDLGGGYYRIVNRESGLALDVNGSSTADGAGIIQWPSQGGTNQQWQLIKL